MFYWKHDEDKTKRTLSLLKLIYLDAIIYFCDIHYVDSPFFPTVYLLFFYPFIFNFHFLKFSLFSSLLFSSFFNIHQLYAHIKNKKLFTFKSYQCLYFEYFIKIPINEKFLWVLYAARTHLLTICTYQLQIKTTK